MPHAKKVTRYHTYFPIVEKTLLSAMEAARRQSRSLIAGNTMPLTVGSRGGTHAPTSRERRYNRPQRLIDVL